jgi:hypothetical protein
MGEMIGGNVWEVKVGAGRPAKWKIALRLSPFSVLLLASVAYLFYKTEL